MHQVPLPSSCRAVLFRLCKVEISQEISSCSLVFAGEDIAGKAPWKYFAHLFPRGVSLCFFFRLGTWCWDGIEIMVNGSEGCCYARGVAF